MPRKVPKLYFLLQRAQHILKKGVDRELISCLGVSAAQLGALLFLEHREGCQHRELAEALSVNKSAVTTLVARLDAQGLIRRRPCAEDARAIRLELSDKARKLLRRSAAVRRELNTRFVDGFSDDEIAIVERFLLTTIERGEFL